MEKEVIWSVRLCGAPRTVGITHYTQAVQVVVEASVSYPEPGDSGVKGTAGAKGPPVWARVTSTASKSKVRKSVCQESVPVLGTSSPE